MGTQKVITESERSAISLYLNLLGVKHKLVRSHCQRVGTNSARVARKLGKDVKAAYLGGIYHDIGKVLIDSELFSGRNVTKEEYEKIKEHALIGHEIMKSTMLFTSLCCGFHHAMGKDRWYGLSISGVPKNLSPRTIKKALEISEIISICDFVDAFTTRSTTLIGSDPKQTLPSMLSDRYPESELVVNTVLEEFGIK